MGIYFTDRCARMGTAVDRFWSKVNISGPDDCWEWLAYRNSDGYGQFRLNNKMAKAHRISYLLYFGSFDETLCVCHKCDNPKCVNPRHLFLGTHYDNMYDMIEKGRFNLVSPNKDKTHCVRGHEFTNDNTRITPTNKRSCLTCRTHRDSLRSDEKHNYYLHTKAAKQAYARKNQEKIKAYQKAYKAKRKLNNVKV